MEAWSVESREGEELVVAGVDEATGAPWLARAREAARAVFTAHGVTPPWDSAKTTGAADAPGTAGTAGTAGAAGTADTAARARPVPGGGSVRFAGLIPRDEYRALLRRSRVFLSAPRREDYGIAQLEALADGCVLVTTNAPGPYVALPIARTLDNRLVGPRLAIRAALDAPSPITRSAPRRR